MQKLFVLLLVMISTLVYGQTEVYTAAGKTMVSKTALEAKKKEMKERFTKLLKKEMFVSTKISKTIRRNDSIIHFISFDIKDQKSSSEPSANDKLTGGPLPNFELKDITGKKIALSDLKGKPTLINFWFATCAPCIDEMPHLNALKEKYGDAVNFVAITYEDKERVTKFLSKRAFNFQHITDAQSYIDELGFTSFPVNLFLDKEAKVRKVTHGLPYQRENGKMKIKDAKQFEEILNALTQE